MTTEIFKASVQYNDWKGSSAADSADQKGPSTWLKENGHINDGEFLLGVKMFAGENHGVHEDPVFVEFLIATSGNFENIKTMIEGSAGPIEVRRVRIDMDLSQFIGLFKRFDVTLSRNSMLEGLEYHYDD
ncbi:hypothetical protein [Sedimenticola hydrogenitrophicus]|uniref:hypothetical protein n=1 Tax=Sedimenticola hydrogenitrophicus TaxID=2967975 RepID=UPI0021A2AF3F|nr:hypothetical protein [Sedimenticola hydrogenitrophicus]